MVHVILNLFQNPIDDTLCSLGILKQVQDDNSPNNHQPTFRQACLPEVGNPVVGRLSMTNEFIKIVRLHDFFKQLAFITPKGWNDISSSKTAAAEKTKTPKPRMCGVKLKKGGKFKCRQSNN
jgi:hypothetical protein